MSRDNELLEEQIGFEREKLIKGHGEGFWAPRWDKEYTGTLPFPKEHAKPWPSQNDFLKKLFAIESMAGKNSRIQCVAYRGHSHARLGEESAYVGNRQYSDMIAKICWPEAFGQYYVEKFNVKPSREFYRYVMNFNS